MWIKGDFGALVKELDDLAMQDGLGRVGRREDVFDVEAEGRRYNNIVLEGRISEAVNSVVDTDRGRLYQPEDECSKTGRSVIDILREKHPEVIVPPDKHFDSYEDAEELPESMPVYGNAETVAKAAAKLQGTTGPCDVDGLL